MWKTAAMAVFRSGLLCMAVYALVIDAKLLQEIYTDAHSKLELITRCIVVIVTSPNFINALGNAGIADLYMFRKVWMNLHADPDGASLLQRGCQEILYLKLPPGFYEQVGVVGVAYWYLLWLPYFLPFYLVVFSIVFPCVICYIWFYAPFYFVMYQVNMKVVEPCMDTPTRNTSLDEELLTNVERPTSAVQAKILTKMVGDSGTTKMLGSDVPTADVGAEVLTTLGIDYDVEERWFHTLGFPKFAFTNYLAYTVINPILLPLATIMFVRLIDGLGYWDPFYTTCSERTMAGYISHLVGNAESQVAIIENLLR
mmetsp:Transcript_920/g.2614  ORF Transcript_920/g.2614 Transcript_920/m.2614 type:complete len:312 (-) Transcript_920:88-1023(-)